VVHLIGDVRGEVSERVVGDGSQVHHGVETLEVFLTDVSDVDPFVGDGLGSHPEVTTFEEATIESVDFVAASRELRY
jgi:hypothetical protein